MKEVHPVNGLVHRSSDGVWGTDIQPVLQWESAASRIILPDSLVKVLPLEIPVLRWSAQKIAALERKRPDVMSIIERLSYELLAWSIAGQERNSGNWRVLFVGSDSRYYAFSIGQDDQYSWNAITIVGSSNPAFWRNRQSGLRDPIVRS